VRFARAALIAAALAAAAAQAQEPALRLESLAERIAKLHAQVGQGVLAERSKRALPEAVREFDGALKSASARATTAEARESYLLLRLLWQDLRPWTLKPPTRDNAKRISDRVEEVTWVAAKGARMTVNPGRKGTAVLENVSGYPALTGVRDGFKEELKKLCPACKLTVVDISLADLGAGKLQETVLSAVRREQADYVFWDNGAFAAGIESKMQAAGLGDVKIGGLSPQPESVKALKAGTQSAWMGIGFQYVGWASMDLAFRHLQDVPLTTNNAIQPTQLLTKDNVKEGTWEYPADGLEQFKKLWQLQ